MHNILDTFLRDHIGLYEKDETTNRELKIIELLKSKSVSVAAGGPIHSPPMPRKRELEEDTRISALRSTSNESIGNGSGSSQHHPAEARILLELGQSRSRNENGNGNGNGNGVRGLSTYGSDSAMAGASSAASSPAWDSRPLNQMRTNDGISTPAAGAMNGFNASNLGMIDVSNASPLDEEESAQRLLDNWVNHAQVDSVGGATFGSMGGIDSLGIGPGALNGGGWASMGGTDMSENGGYTGLAPSRAESVDGGYMGLPPGAAGLADASTDWNYWETLVNSIRASGGMA